MPHDSSVVELPFVRCPRCDEIVETPDAPRLVRHRPVYEANNDLQWERDNAETLRDFAERQTDPPAENRILVNLGERFSLDHEQVEFIQERHSHRSLRGPIEAWVQDTFHVVGKGTPSPEIQSLLLAIANGWLEVWTYLMADLLRRAGANMEERGGDDLELRDFAFNIDLGMEMKLPFDDSCRWRILDRDIPPSPAKSTSSSGPPTPRNKKPAAKRTKASKGATAKGATKKTDMGPPPSLPEKPTKKPKADVNAKSKATARAKAKAREGPKDSSLSLKRLAPRPASEEPRGPVPSSTTAAISRSSSDGSSRPAAQTSIRSRGTLGASVQDTTIGGQEPHLTMNTAAPGGSGSQSPVVLAAAPPPVPPSAPAANAPGHSSTNSSTPRDSAPGSAASTPTAFDDDPSDGPTARLGPGDAATSSLATPDPSRTTPRAERFPAMTLRANPPKRKRLVS